MAQLGIRSAIPVSAFVDSAPCSSYSEDVDQTISTLVGEEEVFRLTDDQPAIIKSISYQEGADVLCSGLHIGPMRDEEFRPATADSLVLRSEVMFAFGDHGGATITAGNSDLPAFYAKADLDRLDLRLVAWIWQ